MDQLTIYVIYTKVRDEANFYIARYNSLLTLHVIPRPVISLQMNKVSLAIHSAPLTSLPSQRTRVIQRRVTLQRETERNGRRGRGGWATKLSRRFGNIATVDKLALIPGR